MGRRLAGGWITVQARWVWDKVYSFEMPPKGMWGAGGSVGCCCADTHMSGAQAVRRCGVRTGGCRGPASEGRARMVVRHAGWSVGGCGFHWGKGRRELRGGCKLL